MARSASQNKSSPYTRLPKSSTAPQTPAVAAEFSNLFVLDATPSTVPTESLYTATADPHATLDAQEQEDEDMRIFAIEVAPSDEDLLDDDDEEEDSREINVVDMAVYDNPHELEQAIKGKITDDSAAKVTGRYYKEIDLTRSCGLCGEQGHTSRECTHSQCFTCGEVDGDHEARNCPVTLVCSSCASRGHFSRDCPLAQGGRSSYGARCGLCQSGLHATSNCSSHWRVYDTADAKPTKRKVTYACGNDGSTDDHFIDDCLLPRMHPIRFVDSSAFNRAAVGSSSGSSQTPSSRRQTSGAAGEAVSARRRGASSQSQQQQREQEAADDDDWFASRDKATAAASGGNPRFKKKSRTGPVKEREIVKSDCAGRGRFSKMNAERKSTREGAYALAASGGSSRGNGTQPQSADRRQRSPPPHQSSGGGGHPSGGGGSQQKVHIHFPSASRDRYRDSPSADRSSGSRGDKQNDDRRRGANALDYGAGGPSGGSSRGGSDLASRISEPSRSGGGGRSGGSSRGGGGGRGRSAPAYNGSYF